MKLRTFNVQDIPKNFDLSKYDVCASWELAEWRAALSHRYTLKVLSEMSPDDWRHESEEGDGWTFNDVADWTVAHFDDPLPSGLLEPLVKEKWVSTGFDEPLVLVERSPQFLPPAASPIQDLTAFDYYAGLFDLNDERYEGTNALAATVNQEWDDEWSQEQASEFFVAQAKLRETPAWRIHRQANPYEDQFCVRVDLGTSDDNLLKGFKAWLKATRAAADIPRITRDFDAADFSDWHEKRLLPYIDLDLWARAHDGKLTLPVLGYVLFPDEPERAAVRGVESVLRRTVAPAAQMLLSKEMISALSIQARKST